jgi:peptide-methionine (S)-S-oxide reductase
VLDVKVGFMGDAHAKKDPTYREVCSGTTGHVEVAQVTFNPAKASYEDLVRFFFSFHDPTTPDRQGNDAGPQYASAIFVHDSPSSADAAASADTQEAAARRVIAELDSLLSAGAVPFRPNRAFAGKTVTTAVRPAGVFYPAHEDHQLYLAKNPDGYCNHSMRFDWPVAK